MKLQNYTNKETELSKLQLEYIRITESVKNILNAHPDTSDSELLEYIRYDSDWLCLTDAEEILKSVRNEK